MRRSEEASRERIGGCLGSFLFGLALVWLWCVGWLVFLVRWNTSFFFAVLSARVCVCLGWLVFARMMDFFFMIVRNR